MLLQFSGGYIQGRLSYDDGHTDMRLFETYIHSDSELQVDQDELEDELLQAGFSPDDAYKFIKWLKSCGGLNAENQAVLILCSIPRTFAASRGFHVLIYGVSRFLTVS